ncbi:MFS transporter [Rhodoplanes sp. Z2-YC6860]|uniref:MFS transporter n=1 Tax=Rhodoplanes sp. Z2-YC6860 TaxID=674703 RepID=UPI00078B96A6|nr:MFS transporter [Rhodoplanes sp. Z2-YC6860]AMN40080.1 arabinose efflux permease family protein [Rhodoplanes sp. Z2-YC6860]
MPLLRHPSAHSWGALAPFRVRSYRYQWPADLVTSWAFEMETLILGWYMLVETNSVVMLTIFGALLYVGTLIAPLIGVLSDRVGHRVMLTGMRSAYALVAGTLTTLAFTGTLRPAIVLVLAFFTGLLRPSDMGLRGAMIADTMPPGTLTAAMGISRTTTDTARIFGALTGAGLFAAIGIGPSYIAITAIYVVGAILTWNAVVPDAAREVHQSKDPGPELSPWRELWEGMVLVWNTPRLLAIVWYAFLFNFAVFPLTNGLMPYAAKDIFLTDQKGLGYLVASVALGAFIGSLGMTRSGMRTELAQIMIVAAVIWHILVLVFAQTHTLEAGAAMLVLCGFAQSLTMVSHTVILLSASDHRYRGRIMGVRMLAIYSLPLGLLVAGGLINLIGYRATASCYAIVGLAFTVLIAVRWRASLWQARTFAEAPAAGVGG